MLKNPFFVNRGPFSIQHILKECELDFKVNGGKFNLYDVKNLNESSDKDLTFFHSNKYKDYAKNTKAKLCITTEKLKEYLPKSCEILITENVLLTFSKITKLFYPSSSNDKLNINLQPAEKIFINTL